VNPIEAVVLPLKAEAMDKAEQFARDTIAGVRKLLLAASNDLRVAAPYPDSLRMNRIAYMVALGQYQLFQQLTTWRKSSISHHEPCFADVDDKKCEVYIKEARENAAFQYDAFVAKLNKKIGEALTARLEGNHVWGYSFLFVTTGHGSECWKTQQIINCSKLGKIFNQFPTRKVKEKV
jgi:hypothetical protein